MKIRFTKEERKRYMDRMSSLRYRAHGLYESTRDIADMPGSPNLRWALYLRGAKAGMIAKAWDERWRTGYGGSVHIQDGNPN